MYYTFETKYFEGVARTPRTIEVEAETERAAYHKAVNMMPTEEQEDLYMLEHRNTTACVIGRHLTTPWEKKTLSDATRKFLNLTYENIWVCMRDGIGFYLVLDPDKTPNGESGSVSLETALRLRPSREWK